MPARQIVFCIYSFLHILFSENTFARRGGWKYACDEVTTQWMAFRMGFLSVYQFLSNVLIRFTVRIIPNGLRSVIYKKLLRK